jgi:hypothetical protein
MKCPNCKKQMHKNGHSPGGAQRYLCGTKDSICYAGNPNEPVRGQNGRPSARPAFDPEPTGKQTFLITAAQNATPVHPGAWASLMRAKKFYDAELLIQPLSYNNPTSTWSKNASESQWWADETAKYLCNVRRLLNKNLEFLCDIPILPTATEPLTGLEGFGARSKIVGHTKLQFKTVATPSHKMAAALTTTGAITKPNYTDSRAGKMGEFHHSLGAVIVEIEGGYFWLRHLNMNSRGEFIDLGIRFTPDMPVTRHVMRASALILGDTHARTADPVVDAATFGPKGIVESYRPRKIVWHDLNDGQSHNPHEDADPFVEQALASGDMDDVEAEVNYSIRYAATRTPEWAQSFVVASNHDDFLRRWIVKQDWKKLATKNRAFYLKCAKFMVDGSKLVDGMAHYPSPFPYLVNSHGQANIRALSLGEPLTIEGIQCGYHGHKGPGGAPGSIRNMRRIGEKTVIAHGHGPGINEGAYQVGHNAKEGQPYAKGSPSAWMHTDCLIYPGGKRQLITIVNGRHRR